MFATSYFGTLFLFFLSFKNINFQTRKTQSFYALCYCTGMMIAFKFRVVYIEGVRGRGTEETFRI